jgi:hypothetical protein
LNGFDGGVISSHVTIIRIFQIGPNFSKNEFYASIGRVGIRTHGEHAIRINGGIIDGQIVEASLIGTIPGDELAVTQLTEYAAWIRFLIRMDSKRAIAKLLLSGYPWDYTQRYQYHGHYQNTIDHRDVCFGLCS